MSKVILALLMCVTATVVVGAPREEWGAVPVVVSHDGNTWTIVGKKNTVLLNATDLRCEIRAGGATWSMVASGANDTIVKHAGASFPLRLADAGKIAIAPYDAGYKSGVKIVLSEFKHDGKQLDLALYLTLALEGKDEELAFDVAATESDTR